MSERRFENRFLCADIVRLDWLTGENEFTTVEAVLEDISALGACVQVETRVPTGASVSMSATSDRTAGRNASPRDEAAMGASFFGQVSYCEYRDYGYFVGIQFSDTTRWSSGVFEPRHLTNLAAFSQPDRREQETPGARKP